MPHHLSYRDEIRRTLRQRKEPQGRRRQRRVRLRLPSVSSIARATRTHRLVGVRGAARGGTRVAVAGVPGEGLTVVERGTVVVAVRGRPPKRAARSARIQCLAAKGW